MNRLIVARRRPWRLLAGILMLIVLIVIGGWLVAGLAHWELIQGQMASNQLEQNEWQADRNVTEQIQHLHEQLAVLRTERNMEKQTASELQEQIRRLQGEIYSLTRELEFYRGIVSATKDVDGLNVQALRVEPTTTPDQYRIILVLTRVVKGDGLAKGSVRMTLEGSRYGSEHELRIDELAGDSQVAKLDYHFKQFKRFEGFVDLPSGFAPRRVRVELLPKNGNHAKIERVFEWPEVTG